MPVRLDFYGLKDVFEYARENGYGLVHVHNAIIGKRYLMKKTKKGYSVKPLKSGKDYYKLYLGDNSFLDLQLINQSLEGCEDLFGSLAPVVRSIRDYLSSQDVSWLSFSPYELTKDIKKKAEEREISIRYHLYENNTKDKLKSVPQEAIEQVFSDLSYTVRNYFSYLRNETKSPGVLINTLEDLEYRLSYTTRRNLENQFYQVGGTRRGGEIEKEASKAINKAIGGMWHDWIWREETNTERKWNEYNLSEIFETSLAHIFRVPKEYKNPGWSRDWPLIKKKEYSVRLDGRNAKLTIYYNGVVPPEPDEEIDIMNHHQGKVLPLGKLSLMVEVSYEEDKSGLEDVSVPEYPQAEGLYFRPHVSGPSQVGFMITDVYVSGNPENEGMELGVFFTLVSMRSVSVRLARAREDRSLLPKGGSRKPKWPIDTNSRISVFSEVWRENEGKVEKTEEYPLNLFFFSDFSLLLPEKKGKESLHPNTKYYEMISFDPENHRTVLVGKTGAQGLPDQLDVDFLDTLIRYMKIVYYKSVAMDHPVGASFARKQIILFNKIRRLLSSPPDTRPPRLPISFITLNKNIAPISTELCFSEDNGRVPIDSGLGSVFLSKDLIHLYEGLGPGEEYEEISVPKVLMEVHKYLFPSEKAKAPMPIASIANILMNKGGYFDDLMAALKEVEARGYSLTILGQVNAQYEKTGREEELDFSVYQPIVSISNNRGYRVFVI